MNKQEIVFKLKADHQSFVDYILQLSNEEFLAHPPGKWSAGQQLDHIYRSVKPVAMAFGIPDMFVKMMFGKANRNSRTYAEIVAKYKQKLTTDYKPNSKFSPEPVRLDERLSIAKLLILKVGKLCFLVDKCTEEELDTMILPHPLLGKITLREMLYFTIYHVEHHLLLTKKYLELVPAH